MDQDHPKADGDFRWETFRGIGNPAPEPSQPPRFWPTLARFFHALWKKQMRHAFDGSRWEW